VLYPAELRVRLQWRPCRLRGRFSKGSFRAMQEQFEKNRDFG
jgi:hypothetical protein